MWKKKSNEYMKICDWWSINRTQKLGWSIVFTIMGVQGRIS